MQKLNKVSKCQKVFRIFRLFLNDASDFCVAEHHRLNVKDLTVKAIYTLDESIDEVVYCSSLSYKIKDKRIMCLYLSCWFYFRSRIDFAFEDMTERKYDESENELLERISTMITDRQRDRIFKRAIDKVIIHLNGREEYV